LVCVLIAAGAQAQASLAAYNGAYLYVKRTGDRGRIDEAIDAATADLGLVQRSIARKRLRESTQPFPRFQVVFEDECVLLRLTDREFDLPGDGHAINTKGLGGDPVKASAHIHGHDLNQTLEGDRGTRYLEFQFHDDGSVSIRTRIESEYLPQQISYTLTYRRAT
jgi:hypothetical protein